MRYFKAKRIIKDGTTLDFVGWVGRPGQEGLGEINSVLYAEIDGITYWGTNKELENQYPECEVTEVKYEEIKSILDNCEIMKAINKEAIEDQIAKVYSLAAEIGMTKKADDLPEKIAYNEFVAKVKAEANLMKVKSGLKT